MKELSPIQKKIVANNLKIGLKTEFFSDPNKPAGYTENGVVYINELFDNLEMINKHEVLHNFEKTMVFKRIKKLVLENLTSKEKQELYEDYYVRYAGLYDLEAIKNGILNTEIVIDIIIGNGEFRKDLVALFMDSFNIITAGHNAQKVAKRYLNISLSNQIENAFPQATTWEKIFVLNFYDGKNHIKPTSKDTKYKELRGDIQAELDRLYSLAGKEEYFSIDTENNPELERQFESELKAFEARGEKKTADYFRKNKAQALKEMAKKISGTQMEEYKHIVDFIKSTEYEPAFKVLMLSETLSKTYKKEKDETGEKTIVKKREVHKSLAGHMTLNEDVLKVIYNNLKEYSSFSNLYFAGLEVFNNVTAQRNEVKIDGIDTFGMGKWIRFQGKKSNVKEYVKNAQELASLVQNTPWCTKNLASSQLAQGDFFVFVDNHGDPHIAVKMSGDEIDEVRGIKNGSAQEVEEDYRKVAIEFLSKNKNIKNGDKWLEKEQWNKRLIVWAEKIETETLKEEDVDQLLFDAFEFVDYKSHSSSNSNKDRVIEAIKNSYVESNKRARAVIAKKFDCRPEEIGFEAEFADQYGQSKYRVILGDADFIDKTIFGKPFNLTKIFGDAYFTRCRLPGLGSIEYISGDVSFNDSNIWSLDNLEIIGGNVDFSYALVQDLGNLKHIRGKADFFKSQITSLNELESIGGYANFNGSDITTLGKLRSIGGDAVFNDSIVSDLSDLERIGGNAIFKDSNVNNLGKLKSIGGSANFSRSLVTSLGQLETIEGNVNFDESHVTDLGKLKSIGGNAVFCISILKSLGNLEKIEGNAYFQDSIITDLGELKSIGGSAYFANSKITDLGNLEKIGGSAWFKKSQIKNLGKLRCIGGDAYFADSKITDLVNLEKIEGSAWFDNSEIRSLGKLQYIGGDVNFKNCKITDIGDLKEIKGNIYNLSDDLKKLFEERFGPLNVKECYGELVYSIPEKNKLNTRNGDITK